MAGLVPAIHVLIDVILKNVDARHKAGHDGNTTKNGGALQAPPWPLVIKAAQYPICFFISWSTQMRA
jgi:hypothetical protein